MWCLEMVILGDGDVVFGDGDVWRCLDLASPGSGFGDDCWYCGEVVVVIRLRLMSRD
jgi:hypothetical protein